MSVRFLYAPLPVVLLALVAAPISGSAFAQSDVPLPNNIQVKPPARGVPKQLAAFSGRWAGVWDGVMNTVLVVEEITSSSAVAVYGWGNAPMWNTRAGWERVEGVWEGRSLKLTFSNGVVTRYSLQADGTLDARYQRGSTVARARMTKAAANWRHSLGRKPQTVNPHEARHA